jgi:hypothetical protein
MASIRKQLDLAAAPDAVWAAFRDVGAVHTRLARGFVTDCRMDGADRIVTFINEMVAREVIVNLDDEARRLVYSARTDRLQHHNASFTVSAHGSGTRVVWVADFLPDAIAPAIAAMMEQGVAAMRKTLDGHSAAA